ncbi:MAG TPA: hypothetical protein VF753_15500 [Terriglobales bacterium]
MRISETYFQQVPLELVKKIAKEDVSVQSQTDAVAATGSARLKPQRLVALGRKGKSVNRCNSQKK